uniref:Uncharacterized protein n=1 Tax=Manihot esculenta TaxID=3983 RepID=A0A2C9V1G6_MANES
MILYIHAEVLSVVSMPKTIGCVVSLVTNGWWIFLILANEDHCSDSYEFIVDARRENNCFPFASSISCFQIEF